MSYRIRATDLSILCNTVVVERENLTKIKNRKEGKGSDLNTTVYL